MLKRMVRKFEPAYPGAVIVLWANGGFAVPEIYQLCEREQIFQVMGISGNKRLKAKVEATGAKAQALFHMTRVKQRLFAAFGYRARSWRRARRMMAKKEQLDKGLKVRFLVTKFLTLCPQYVCDRLWVLRRHLKGTAPSYAKICRVRSDPYIIW